MGFMIVCTLTLPIKRNTCYWISDYLDCSAFPSDFVLLKESKYLFPEDLRWTDSYILPGLFCVTGYEYHERN